MSCLPSPILSLTWGHLLISVAKLCSPKHQSQSFTPTAIPFSQAGKTSVTVFHPDGHPLLSGWRDETGPRLWHFPLTAEAAQTALANAAPQQHILPTVKAAHVAVDTVRLASKAVGDHWSF